MKFELVIDRCAKSIAYHEITEKSGVIKWVTTLKKSIIPDEISLTVKYF